MPHSYHVTIVMDDGSEGRHCGLYRDSASAALRAIELFPDAARIIVLRLATALARGPVSARPTSHRPEAA